MGIPWLLSTSLIKGPSMALRAAARGASRGLNNKLKAQGMPQSNIKLKLGIFVTHFGNMNHIASTIILGFLLSAESMSPWLQSAV